MSTIPAAIDALVDLLGSYPALSDVQVLDGLEDVEIKPDVILVGWAVERTAVTATEDRASLYEADDNESYEIACTVSAERGDPGTKPVRDRCFEIVRGFRRALAEDPTLGGVVISARLAVVDFDQTPTETGPSATAEVVVNVMADVFD